MGCRFESCPGSQSTLVYHVYVLRNPRGTLYVGQTAALALRVEQHQRGEAGWTRSHGPWELAYTEEFQSRSHAMRREKFLKSGQGREWLCAKLNGESAAGGLTDGL